MKEAIGEIRILGIKGEKIDSLTISEHTGYFLASASKARKNVRGKKKGPSPSLGMATTDEVLSYYQAKPIFKFLGYSQKEVAEALDLNASTLSRWTKHDKDEPLGKLQSKFVSDIDEVIAKGVKLFGSEENFKNWLNTPNYSLGDVKPIELLKNPYEIEIVDNAIEAMSWGNLM